MSNSTEAVASVTYSLITPNGFPILFTVRGESGKELMDKMTAIENVLKAQNYKPQEKKGFGPKERKPLDIVADRKCPKCGSDLVNKETKTGKKFIECSTRRYDFATKQESGCSFVEWQD